MIDDERAHDDGLACAGPSLKPMRGRLPVTDCAFSRSLRRRYRRFISRGDFIQEMVVSMASCWAKKSI